MPRLLDRDALHACAAALAGTHDFTAFTPTETDHVRFERDVLRGALGGRRRVLEFWIEADAFMRQMNRVLVGTMLEVARRGAASVGGLRRAARRRDRATRAGPTLAPHGLYLASVRTRTEPRPRISWEPCATSC